MRSASMRSVALDRQRLAGVLVDDVQELQDPPVGGLVELEVERPDLVGALCAKPLGRHGRGAEAPALSAALGDALALLEQAGVGSSIAPARTLCRELTEANSQGSVVAWGVRLMALGGAVLAGDPARPTLGEAEAVAEHAGRLAPPGQAQKFPGMKMAPRGAPRPVRLGS